MAKTKIDELIEYKKASLREYKNKPRCDFRPDIEKAARAGEITGLMIAKALLDGVEHREI